MTSEAFACFTADPVILAEAQTHTHTRRDCEYSEDENVLIVRELHRRK